MRLLDGLRSRTGAPVVPVYWGELPSKARADERVPVIRRRQVVIGRALRSGASPEEIRQAIHLLGVWMQQVDQAGVPAVTSMIPGAAAASPSAPAPGRP